MGQKQSSTKKTHVVEESPPDSKKIVEIIKIRPPTDDDECRFNDPFFVIPKDSIRVVLAAFDRNELAVVGQVSRRWRAAANDPYL